MNAAEAIYGAAVAARNALYDRGMFKAEHLPRPVVSIGNIAAGGTGKTPFTMLLGELLRERGVRFDVLSRGYRRRTTGVRVVDAAGDASEFGDEPLLMARRLRVPVVVGESRYRAGLMAEAKFDSQMHLLDDGFQHRQLAREFDIVMLAPEDLDGRLLPTGRLREPPGSLHRADAIVVPEEMDTSRLQVNVGQQVWRVRRNVHVHGGSVRPLAFCGIARPERFFTDLRTSGIAAAAEVAFRDHCRYDGSEVQKLIGMALEKKADGFVTTAKDEINLGGRAGELQRLAIAEVKMELVEADRAMEFLLARLAERGHRLGTKAARSPRP